MDFRAFWYRCFVVLTQKNGIPSTFFNIQEYFVVLHSLGGLIRLFCFISAPAKAWKRRMITPIANNWTICFIGHFGCRIRENHHNKL